MGLAARVYARATGLASTVDLARERKDPQTGEVFSESRGPFIAMQKQMGNASMISWLFEQIAAALTNLPDSAILTKVLYSATHSGDAIHAPDFPQLLREVELVRRWYSGHPNTDIERFLSNLEELVDVAREQDNPIVFV